MTDTNSHIADKIRSGEYYKDAIHWYSDVYHAPISERGFFIVISLICVCVTTFSVLTFYDLQANLKPLVPFTYTNQDSTEYVPRISMIAERGKNKQIGMMRFFVNDYVKAREEYNPQAAEYTDYRRVKALSSKEQYAVYRKSIDLRNPKSPYVLYQKHIRRKVEIVGTQLFLEKEPYVAMVSFIETLEGQGKIKQKRWTAEVNFKYKDILDKVLNQEVANEGDKSEEATKRVFIREAIKKSFLVTGYKTEQR